jgi:hypothetical protein
MLPGSLAEVRACKAPAGAGAVLLAGAAGLALKNRDKLSSLMGRKDTQAEPGTSDERPTVTEPAGDGPRTDDAD